MKPLKWALLGTVYIFLVVITPIVFIYTVVPEEIRTILTITLVSVLIFGHAKISYDEFVKKKEIRIIKAMKWFFSHKYESTFIIIWGALLMIYIGIFRDTFLSLCNVTMAVLWLYYYVRRLVKAYRQENQSDLSSICQKYCLCYKCKRRSECRNCQDCLTVKGKNKGEVSMRLAYCIERKTA